MSPAVEISGASLAFGGRTLWSGLDLNVEPGEFLAILGPNGSGKTSLVKVLLGLQSLSAGSWRIASDRPVGYVPQQRAMHEALTLRGVDLVGLGLDGHRWGVGLRGCGNGGGASRPRSSRWAPRRTRSRRSGACRVASSSGCGWRRR